MTYYEIKNFYGLELVMEEPQSPYVINDGNSYVLNDGNLIYQETQQPLATHHPQQQQPQASSYIIQEDDQIMQQHHHQQQLQQQQQQQQQQQVVQQQPQQIYYAPESSPVQQNQIIHHDQQQHQQQQQQQQQQIIYQVPQQQQIPQSSSVMMSPAPVASQPNQHIIVQPQQNQQHLVIQQPSHQIPHSQQQTSLVVRSNPRVVYKTQTAQGQQNIIYQTQMQPQQQLHQTPPSAHQQQQRYIQQSQTRVVSQQPTNTTPTQNVVFHPVAPQLHQPKPVIQHGTPPSSQTSPHQALNITPSARMPSGVSISRGTRGLSPAVRFQARSSIRPIRQTTPQNIIVSSVPNPQPVGLIPQQSTVRVTRPRLTTTGGRGSRGGRGGRSASATIRMVTSPTTTKLNQVVPAATNLHENVLEHQANASQSKTVAQQIAETSKARIRQIVGQRPNSMPMNQSDDIEDSIQASSISKPPELKPVNDTTLIHYVPQIDNSLQKQAASISVAEYKAQNLLQHQSQQHQAINRRVINPNINQLTMPGNRVIPELPHQQKSTHNPEHVIQTQEIIQNRKQNSDSSAESVERGNARMLVILASGEQRLITFTLPRDSCTVQELLEQVNVPFDHSTTIQCVSSKFANIDYIVTVGIPLPPPECRAEWIRNAEQSLMNSKQQEQQAVAAAAAQAQQQQALLQQQQQQQQQLLQQQQLQAQKLASQQSKQEEHVLPPPKHIKGFLAVCKYCGACSSDFAKCERCRRIFTEEPKKIPTPGTKTSNTVTGSVQNNLEEKKRSSIQNDLLSRAQGKSITITSTPIPGRGRTISITARRGRGGLTTRVSRQITEPEPVILTLSSDDEADEEKSLPNQQYKTNENYKSDLPPLPCEPIISFEDEMPEDQDITNRPNVTDLSNCSDKTMTSLDCQLIRIGTHKFEPKEKVIITSKGVRIIAPSCNKSDEKICLDIKETEVVKVIAHFEKQLPVVFIYVSPKCGAYIRESLEMQTKFTDKDKPYFAPAERGEAFKRICLQIENMFSEENLGVMKTVFKKEKLEEISFEDAKDLLMRSSAKDKSKRLDSNTGKDSDSQIRRLLIYPPGRGGISINTEDYMCLAVDQYLNDVIIDFYLKYVHIHLPSEQKDKTHIFSTFFYKRLTTMSTRHRQNKEDAKSTAAQKRHNRVANWSKNVNLFEKDFIIIPINEQSHWFLAIICFPHLKGPVSYDTMQPVTIQPTVRKKKLVTDKKMSMQIGNTTITPLSKRSEIEAAVHIGDDDESERDEAEGDESDLASDDSDFENVAPSSPQEPIVEDNQTAIKQPMILIFDSLSGASRSRVVATLRDYLTCEYQAKIKDSVSKVNRTFDKNNMPGHCVKVPQQNNFTDCGLYVLQYVEHFFSDPIRDYKTPIKQLVNWFETIVVTKKREDLANLLKTLIERESPKRMPLPEILLPTIDGKLINREGEEEFEEDDELEEDVEEDDEDVENPRCKLNGSSENQEVNLKRSASNLENASTNEPLSRKIKLSSI